MPWRVITQLLWLLGQFASWIQEQNEKEQFCYVHLHKYFVEIIVEIEQVHWWWFEYIYLPYTESTDSTSPVLFLLTSSSTTMTFPGLLLDMILTGDKVCTLETLFFQFHITVSSNLPARVSKDRGLVFLIVQTRIQSKRILCYREGDDHRAYHSALDKILPQPLTSNPLQSLQWMTLRYKGGTLLSHWMPSTSSPCSFQSELCTCSLQFYLTAHPLHCGPKSGAGFRKPLENWLADSHCWTQLLKIILIPCPLPPRQKWPSPNNAWESVLHIVKFDSIQGFGETNDWKQLVGFIDLMVRHNYGMESLKVRKYLPPRVHHTLLFSIILHSDQYFYIIVLLISNIWT